MNPRIPCIPVRSAAALLACCLALIWANTSHAAPLQLQVAFDNDHIPAGRQEARYLEVLVTAPDAASQRPRVPLNLALVIDTSGSMEEQGKLDYVKEAAIAMISRLRPKDRFALVSYSTKARVLYPSQPAGRGQQMQWLISSLQAVGGTNLGDGLLEGYREARRHAGPAMTSRVLLLSDGLANIGVTSNEELAQMALAQGGEDVSLSSFGVGLEFNEDLLAALAESGRGMYYFIDHPESMNSILAKEFKSVEQLAAADIKVSISLGEGLVIDQVFANSYEVSGNQVTVRFGDLAAGERRRMQIRVLPTLRGAGRMENAARVSVSYKEPGGPAAAPLSGSLSIISTEDAAASAASQNKEVLERAAVFEANHARQAAAVAVDKGDQQRAAAILSEARKKIEAAAPAASAKVQNELSAIDSYSDKISKPMKSEERSLEQKKVKLRSQAIEGC